MSSDDDASMKRGIAQVLYNFGEGNIFDYGQHDMAMEVTRVLAKPFGESDEDERGFSHSADRVAGDIKSRAKKFRNGDEPPWDELSASDLDAFRPTRVKGELYPLTMVCENTDCHQVETRPSPTDFYATDHEGQDPGTCPACGSSLQQLPFVLTCECGNVYPPRPTAECEDHGYKQYRLHKPTRDPATWEFRCVCGDDMGQLGNYCEDCNTYLSGPTPPGGGGIYYPQTLVLVAIPAVGAGRDELEQGETWGRILAASHLGLVPIGEENTLEDIASREGEQEEIEQLREEGWSDEDIQQYLEMQADAGREVSHLNRTSVASETDEIFEPVRSGTVDEERAYTTIADQLFTFQRATSGYEGNPADIEDVRHPDPTSLTYLLEETDLAERYPRAEKYREKLDRINVTEAWVVDSFPLLTVLFGYTRESPTARETDLNTFTHPFGDEDKVPVFADRSPSEAIILEIDREAIVQWLLENNVIKESRAPDITEDMDEKEKEREYKAWFLNNVDSVATTNPFEPIEDPVTEEVYTLLHSMSHALISTGSDECGLEADSISELIMPNVPAIALYAQSTKHFALGGMFTLFKTRIHPWVDRAVDHAEQCLFDPACMQDDGGAACHACLHLNPVSCESLNEHLDRQLLVGGEELFWDV